MYYGQTPMPLSDKEIKRRQDEYLTQMPLQVNWINPDNQKPEEKRDCLLKIHLKGEAAGYYDDVFIFMAGGYQPANKQWYYYDITGRYDLPQSAGEVVGWRYLET